MSSLKSRIALAYSLLILGALAVEAAAFSGRWSLGGTPVRAFIPLIPAVCIALTFGMAALLTRRLNQLRRTAGRLVSGMSLGTIDKGGGGELDELDATLRRLANRLHESTESLERAQMRLEALLASSRDATLVLDAAGAVRYLNPAARLLYGEIEGRILTEVARAPELTTIVRMALSTAVEGREAIVASGETALLHNEERDTWMRATASPIGGGGDWAALVVLSDVTEQRRAETTRRDFVANVSHELRTPLAGIKAVVETLRDGALDDRSAAIEFLVRVDDEVDRLVQLVDELLHLARIESGAEMEMATVNPADLLEDCVERFRPHAERAGVVLTLNAPRALPHIRANAGQLGRAIGNLVHNAIKFTPPTGTVTVLCQQEGSELRIRVADTGAGIDPSDLPRIFERFYVTDRARSGRGTGLGLAIVKHVVRAHEGVVDVSSQPGQGSTFTISLPIAERKDGGKAADWRGD